MKRKSSHIDLSSEKGGLKPGNIDRAGSLSALDGLALTGTQIYEIFMEAPAAVAIYSGPEHRLDVANPLAIKLIGQDEEALGKSIRVLRPELESQGLIALFDGVYETGVPFEGEEFPVQLAWGESKEMETRYFNFVLRRIPLPGDRWGLFSHAVDVTELVVTREKITESKERYRGLFTRMDQGFCIVDLVFDAQGRAVDYRIEEINENFTKHTGLSDVIGKTIRSLVPDIEDNWFQVYSDVWRSGVPAQFIEHSVAMGRWFEVDAYRVGEGGDRRVAILFKDITEFRKRNEELQQTKDQLALIVENSTNAIILYDAAGTIVNANTLAARLYGFSSADVFLKQADRAAVRDHYLAQFALYDEQGNPLGVGRSPVERAFHGEKEPEIVIRSVNRKTREETWWLLKANAINDERGAIQYVLLSGTDISLQKSHQRVQAALSATEARFSFMADNIAQLAWITDKNGYIFWYNQRWFNYTGTTLDDMLGWGWTQAHHPDHVERVVNKYKVAIARGEDWEDTFPLLGKDGTYRWFLSRAVAIRNERGEITNWFGTNTDITDRRKAREKLSYQKGLLEAQQKVSPLGIIAIDPKGHILTYNQRFATLWRVPEYDLIGQNVNVLRQRTQVLIEDVIRPDVIEDPTFATQVASHEKLFRTDGRIIERFGAPIQGEQGAHFGYAFFYLDVTDHERLLRQKDDFLGIASHELKTPVTSILAYAQLLQQRFADSEDQRTYGMLTKMNDQLNRLTLLINDLLDVTKIEQGKLKLRKEYFDFNHMVRETVEGVQRTTTSHHIRVEATEPLNYFGDRERIGQVLTNFLTNAIKYSPDADTVEVVVSQSTGRIGLAVRDYGLGVKEADRNKVFQRFFRVEGKAWETFPGLGLGLYISAEIIQRHGGEIGVESQPDAGSTFYFYLPTI